MFKRCLPAVIIACLLQQCPRAFIILPRQAKTGVLGALGPARAGAAIVAAHAAARWTALPLTYGCHYIQDTEDAKRGLYNWCDGVAFVQPCM